MAPLSILFPKPIQGPPLGQVNDERTRKDCESPPAAILPKKPAMSAMLPKDCPMIISHAINVGISSWLLVVRADLYSHGQERRVGDEVLGDDLVGEPEIAVLQVFPGVASAALLAPGTVLFSREVVVV